ncbi:uncharacterized protein SCHCODRAFT_02373996 [Schizophyllum commune H4-8]|nr:uncharacterized protein SCHCODRAFT_02373996 [Schizophyllum commune H4-8]KAI5889683.1 hypothetical protein SCHCODRAFT_02373996 [Schizophyllum commune H4-8]
MASAYQDPSFSPANDAELLAQARSVLSGTLKSQQHALFSQPLLYVSGALAGRSIRGELHELRDLQVNADGMVVPAPVLLGRLFEIKKNEQGSKEVEIDEEEYVAILRTSTGERLIQYSDRLDLLCLFEASTVNGGEEMHARDALHDVITSPAQLVKVDGHPCYFFHFPDLVFKRSGTFRLSFFFFEQGSFPAQPELRPSPAQPAGDINIMQAKCPSRSVLVVPHLASEDASADGEAA